MKSPIRCERAVCHPDRRTYAGLPWPPKVQNRLLREDAQKAWRTLYKPPSTSDLLNLPSIGGEIAPLIPKGRRYIEYAATYGLGPAPKKSRVYYPKMNGPYDTGVEDFHTAIDNQNEFAIGIRGNAQRQHNCSTRHS